MYTSTHKIEANIRQSALKLESATDSKKNCPVKISKPVI